MLYIKIFFIIYSSFLAVIFVSCYGYCENIFGVVFTK